MREGIHGFMTLPWGFNLFHGIFVNYAVFVCVAEKVSQYAIMMP